MAEHVMHKKETKKAPQKNLKEKREQKKAKKKSKEGWGFSRTKVNFETTSWKGDFELIVRRILFPYSFFI